MIVCAFLRGGLYILDHSVISLSINSVPLCIFLISASSDMGEIGGVM